MKAHRIVIGAVVGLLTAATVGATGPPASADVSTGFRFQGSAAGSLVRALNSTVTSGLTAQASIDTEGLQSSTNGLAGVTVPSLLTAGALTTSAASTAIDGGYQVRSEARTSGVKLLGGLITADAVDTVSIAKVVNGVASSSVQTTFVNLRVGLSRKPVTVRPNTTLKIGRIATVVLNSQQTSSLDQSAVATGAGITVTLLKPQGTSGIGATVQVSPTTARMDPIAQYASGHALSGMSYGTKAVLLAGDLATVTSDETAPVTLPPSGTDGQVLTSSIASVNLNPSSVVGAVTNTAQGINTELAYDGQTTSRVAAVNLLDGLIRADVVESFARVRGLTNAVIPSVTGGATLTNLVINGRPIDVDQAPNTVHTIAGVATITVNQQIRPTNRSIIVRALDIRLLADVGGLHAGAEIEIGVSRVAVD